MLISQFEENLGLQTYWNIKTPMNSGHREKTRRPKDKEDTGGVEELVLERFIKNFQSNANFKFVRLGVIGVGSPYLSYCCAGFAPVLVCLPEQTV